MKNIFTAASVRAAYKAGGLAHAENCLLEAESQRGRNRCLAARAEWERLAKEDARACAQ